CLKGYAKTDFTVNRDTTKFCSHHIFGQTPLMTTTAAQDSRSSPGHLRDGDDDANRGRVLIVHDNPPSTIYYSLLDQAGLMVIPACNGTAALIALRRDRPQVVIVDTSLKGLTSDELSRMLAQAHDNVPFVLVGQAEASHARRLEALSNGAFDYFQIPTEVALLMARTAQLVDLKQSIERLRAEADRDYLTGLANRRRFRKALGQEVERWRRYRLPCALLLADIDHLKTINDTFGHPAGDIVIRHVAGALIMSSRDNDTAARLGGEEFALLLAGADSIKALAAAERLRHAVSAAPVPNIGTVTISIGVSSCPTHADSERELYGASDAALYGAKEEAATAR
ncbi:MAG: diguanylate cyclase, partial [Pyrinomonadaceae bacterium]